MGAKDVFGRRGEELAAHALERAGLEILDRNWRCGAGELDIVARDGRTLAVCEVKTRSATACGSPLDAVTPGKVVRLRRLALMWLAQRRAAGGGAARGSGRRPGFDGVRFDVVSVLVRPDGSIEVRHVRGVE